PRRDLLPGPEGLRPRRDQPRLWGLRLRRALSDGELGHRRLLGDRQGLRQDPRLGRLRADRDRAQLGRLQVGLQRLARPAGRGLIVGRRPPSPDGSPRRVARPLVFLALLATLLLPAPAAAAGVRPAPAAAPARDLDEVVVAAQQTLDLRASAEMDRDAAGF